MVPDRSKSTVTPAAVVIEAVAAKPAAEGHRERERHERDDRSGRQADVQRALAGGADRSGVLADAAREDESVEPAERRRQRAELAADPVDEQLHRLGGARVGAGEQLAHVAGRAGDAEQA